MSIRIQDGSIGLTQSNVKITFTSVTHKNDNLPYKGHTYTDVYDGNKIYLGTSPDNENSHWYTITTQSGNITIGNSNITHVEFTTLKTFLDSKVVVQSGGKKKVTRKTSKKVTRKTSKKKTSKKVLKK
jgi:hypothetical protein